MDDTADVWMRCKRRFPTLATPRKEDICYATQNRQDAVKKLVDACDVVIVVGSQTSSNSNRLREIAEKAGIPGYLVDGPDDLRPEWFEGKTRGRCDGGRIGARSAGAARRRAPARVGWAGPGRSPWPGGERRVRPAARTAFGSSPGRPGCGRHVTSPQRLQHSPPLDASVASRAVFTPWLFSRNTRHFLSSCCGPVATALAVADHAPAVAAFTSMA